ncbi:hypothetical protein [Clostridium sp.]|uniref:hypothetical protein n=1 Tax=Clostridium sp. TaxID=1506 RepID=UPI001A400FDF|nr:hypothetical protein [Clostridium sp.]MBK5243260.1 hypothetical protein [Clostridium sp.]
MKKKQFEKNRYSVKFTNEVDVDDIIFQILMLELNEEFDDIERLLNKENNLLKEAI